MRALLDLMLENKAAVQGNLAACQELLRRAVFHLKILDPEHGDEELIMAVAAEVSNLRGMAGTRLLNHCLEYLPGRPRVFGAGDVASFPGVPSHSTLARVSREYGPTPPGRAPRSAHPIRNHIHFESPFCIVGVIFFAIVNLSRG